MVTGDMDALIAEALPGNPLKIMRGVPQDVQRPLWLWASHGTKWAIYNINGSVWPKTTEVAIRKLQSESSIEPCLLVNKSEYLGTVARPFVELKVPVIVEVGGGGRLIRPRKINKRGTEGKNWQSRISPRVLEECTKSNGVDAGLQNLLVELINKYRRKRKWTDDYEQNVLNDFFLAFAGMNGLSADAARAQVFLRKLEQAGMAGSRDHYFHSFQNFFLGLWVVCEARDYFEKWLEVSMLQWKIPLEFTWFLICMWHDVGYGVYSLKKIEHEAFGVTLSGDGQEPLSAYLTSGLIIEGKRIIASLIEHLLQATTITAWVPPQNDDARTEIEEKVERAIYADLRGGHGAASALRLYTDMKSFISKCAVQEKRHMLTQATWIAAVSIPFHDWHFRKCVREECGDCRVPALTMPFAALLAFVDSIQEDRRKLEGIGKDKAFLQELAIDEERIISARVDGSALGKEDIIWKIVEAIDVLAALEINTQSFDVEYPKWLVE